MHTCTHTHIQIYTYTYLILSSISFTLLHLLVSYWFLGYDEVILHRCGICTYIATSPLWGSYQYINISRYFQWGLVLYTYPLALYIKLMSCWFSIRISYFCPPSDIGGFAIPNVISIKFSYTEVGHLITPCLFDIICETYITLFSFPIMALTFTPRNTIWPHQFKRILNCVDNTPVQIEDNACTKFLHISWRIHILII